MGLAKNKVPGLPFDCEKEERVETAQNQLDTHSKEHILKPFKLNWSQVLSCTIQYDDIITVRSTVNLNGIVCEITTKRYQNKFIMHNIEETLNHCSTLFEKDFKLSSISQNGKEIQESKKEDDFDEVIDEKINDPKIRVGGTYPCPDQGLKEMINTYLQSLAKTHIKPIQIKKADILDCIKSSSKGYNTVFMISVKGKNCRFDMRPHSNPVELVNAKSLFQDCPELFVDKYVPAADSYRLNLIL